VGLLTSSPIPKYKPDSYPVWGEMNTLAQTITTPLTSKGSKTLRTVTGSLQSCNTHTEQI